MKGDNARWFVGLAVTLLLAGCSTPQTSPAPSPSRSNLGASASCSDPATFCIGLAIESGIVDDGAFNAAAWQGVRQAADVTGGIAEYLEPTANTSYADNLEEFAAREFDVVVTTGVGQPETTIQAAAEHPDTWYIGISQDMTDAPVNAIGLLFRDDEAGYAAGYLAGLMTRSGTVGAVLGSESVLPLKRFGEGYRRGALAARPDVSVIMTYNNGASDAADSFNDPAWGAATAAEQLAAGADLVFGAGGTTGIAALEAVASSPGAGTSLFCIGIDVDQYETVPEARPCLLTSAEKLIAEGVRDLTVEIHDGVTPDRNVDGAIGLAPYHDLSSQVPDSVTSQVDAVVAGLDDGSITTGVTF